MNSAISDVWVSQQYNPASLSATTSPTAGHGTWTARAAACSCCTRARATTGGRASRRAPRTSLWRNAKLIREFDPQALVVVSADAVYKLDYGALVEEHCEAGKTVTLVTTTVDPEDAGRYGVVQAEDGQVTGYALKPDDPEGNLIANEVFVFEPHRVLDTLDELAEQAGEDGSRTSGTSCCRAWSTPARSASTASTAIGATSARSTPYWEPTRSSSRTSRRSTSTSPPGRSSPHAQSNRASGRICSSAEIVSSVIAPGATVAGSVEYSVVGRGAQWRRARWCADAVLLPGSVVRAGARVERAILDDGVEVGKGEVGERDGEIALVGSARVVGKDVRARRRRALPRLRLRPQVVDLALGGGEALRGQRARARPSPAWSRPASARR